MKSIIIGTLLTIEAFAVASNKIKTYQVLGITFIVSGALITMVIHLPDF
jgi:hypothetical protein